MTRDRACSLLFLPLAALTAGCGADPVHEPDPNPPDPICSVGETKPCYDGPATTAGVGICRAGTRACLADGSGFESICLGQVRPESESCTTKDDDDCNGLVNDGCACEPGQTMACYTGPAGTLGVGDCMSGEATCDADGLGFGACTGQVLPQVESCTSPGDDNCNGQVNEGCACDPGVVAPCYSGSAATLDIGVCKAGSAICLPSGQGFGACTGEVLPAAQDDCATPEDENCDGQANEPASGCMCEPGVAEACYDGPPLTKDVGICVAGSRTCLPSGQAFGSCVGQVVPVAKDDCATLADENCDGVINDAASGCVCQPGATQACYGGPAGTLGVGPCAGGVQTCNAAGDGYGACAGETVPGLEICDGLDNDCNGAIDELGCGGAALWSRGFGSPSAFESGRAVAVDAATGDVVVTGYFAGTVDFGGGPLTSAGGTDIYLARYSSTGTHLWSKRLGGTSFDHGWSLAIDASGNILLAGDVNGTADLGGGPLTTKQYVDGFAAKYTSAGAHVWSKLLGGFQDDSARGIAVDASGNVFVTGSVAKDVSNKIDLGGGPIASFGFDDLFLVKLSPIGAHLWSKLYGGVGDDYGYSVATDSAGDVILAGTASGFANVGGGMTSGGTQEVVVAKYDPAGAHLWSKRHAGTGSAGETDAVAMDASGNILLTGLATGTVDVGGGPLTVIGNKLDAFVVKYTPAGAHVWSLLHADPSGQVGRAIAVDAAGNVALAGNLQGVPKAVFVTKYASGGALVWSKTFTGGADAAAYGVATAPSGKVAFTGFFGGTIDFGAGPLTSLGGQDGFVALLPP